MASRKTVQDSRDHRMRRRGETSPAHWELHRTTRIQSPSKFPATRACLFGKPLPSVYAAYRLALTMPMLRYVLAYRDEYAGHPETKDITDRVIAPARSALHGLNYVLGRNMSQSLDERLTLIERRCRDPRCVADKALKSEIDAIEDQIVTVLGTHRSLNIWARIGRAVGNAYLALLRDRPRDIFVADQELRRSLEVTVYRPAADVSWCRSAGRYFGRTIRRSGAS